MHKIVLIEFNEICPPLLDKWMAAGQLPNFAAFHRNSQVFTTVADETDPNFLEPWIQWYSIHSGLPYRAHKVFHLTDGPKSELPDIWLQLRALGKSVMNCSSMNARALSGPGTFYLPDPWCSKEPAFPRELEIFKTVVAKLVQEHSSGAGALEKSELLSFLSFLAVHGLTAATISAILAQLASERLTRRDVKWKRVALQDRILLDIFQHYYRQMRPDFATYFSNSTAHLQHAFWRHMDPDAFALKPAAPELEVYGDAVLFGYQQMDRMLHRFAALVDADTTLILCSGLSQQPFAKRDDRGGQHFYRLRDVDRFIALAGVAPELVEPVMTHQYMFRFKSAAEAAEAAASLRAIVIGDDRVLSVDPADGNSLYLGCQIYDQHVSRTDVTGFRGRNEELAFFDLFYPIEGVKSGRHHPEGVLWIRTGGHAVHADLVSILDIAPTIRDLMGVELPPAARDGQGGASLVPRFAAAPPAARRVA